MEAQDEYVPREYIPVKWWIRDYINALTSPFAQFQVWSFERRLCAKLEGNG